MGGRDVQRILVYETPIPSEATLTLQQTQPRLGIIGVSKLKRILWALPTGLQGRDCWSTNSPWEVRLDVRPLGRCVLVPGLQR